MKNLILNEHKSASYAPRTYHNASQGVTLAVAVDFNTAGEKLTHKAAGESIVQIKYGEDYVESARKLYRLMKKYDTGVVNVAGNGIYSYAKKGVKQEDVNAYVYSILQLVHKHLPILRIVSGGQTGSDLAGLVVGVKLGVETIGTWPKGFKMRFEDSVDVDMDQDDIRRMILKYANL